MSCCLHTDIISGFMLKAKLFCFLVLIRAFKSFAVSASQNTVDILWGSSTLNVYLHSCILWRHTWQGGEDRAWHSEHVIYISWWLKHGRGSCLQIQKHDFSAGQRGCKTAIIVGAISYRKTVVASYESSIMINMLENIPRIIQWFSMCTALRSWQFQWFLSL
jgi:hypothetical protein